MEHQATQTLKPKEEAWRYWRGGDTAPHLLQVQSGTESRIILYNISKLSLLSHPHYILAFALLIAMIYWAITMCQTMPICILSSSLTQTTTFASVLCSASAVIQYYDCPIISNLFTWLHAWFENHLKLSLSFRLRLDLARVPVRCCHLISAFLHQHFHLHTLPHLRLSTSHTAIPNYLQFPPNPKSIAFLQADPTA